MMLALIGVVRTRMQQDVRVSYLGVIVICSLGVIVICVRMRMYRNGIMQRLTHDC